VIIKNDISLSNYYTYILLPWHPKGNLFRLFVIYLGYEVFSYANCKLCTFKTLIWRVSCFLMFIFMNLWNLGTYESKSLSYSTLIFLLWNAIVMTKIRCAKRNFWYISQNLLIIGPSQLMNLYGIPHVQYFLSNYEIFT